MLTQNNKAQCPLLFTDLLGSYNGKLGFILSLKQRRKSLKSILEEKQDLILKIVKAKEIKIGVEFKIKYIKKKVIKSNPYF